jgi:hypothetical protein
MNDLIIPTADTLPVNWWWFQILLIFTFLIHIILMNFILGGSLLAVFDSFRKNKLNEEFKSIPILIALTVNFGIPPLLFVQVLFGNLFYSSSIFLALPWILVVLFLVLAYYGAYIFVFKEDKSFGFARISLLISTMLILAIAFIYVNNNTLLISPVRWSNFIASMSGNNLNWGEPTLIPRYLHFICGSIAIAGLGKSIYSYFNHKLDPIEKEERINNGLVIFTHATLVEIAIGIWFLFSLRRDVMLLFMGDNVIDTFVLFLGIALIVAVMILGFRRKLWATVFTTTALLLVMIIQRELVRQAYLENIFSPKDMAVNSQISPLIVFLLVFGVGIFALYYMIRISLKSKTE